MRFVTFLGTSCLISIALVTSSIVSTKTLVTQPTPTNKYLATSGPILIPKDIVTQPSARLIKPDLKPSARLLISYQLAATSQKVPESEPIPTPEPTMFPSLQPTLTAPAEYADWFNQYATQFGVPPSILIAIAACESRFNPQAVNSDYVGMFQFSTATWESTRNHMGVDPHVDLRMHPQEAIKTAAFKIGAGGISAWQACIP